MSTLVNLLNPVRVLGDVWDELGILSDRAMDRHLRLAVTGLSRSGKTVFITSAISHLLDGYGLPFLQPVHDGRYLGGRLDGEHRADRFPYARFHADLVAQPPRWPRATEKLTSLRLEIAYRTRSLVLRQIQPVQHLTLEIIDYPGEWLLDLPLLEQSFAQSPMRRWLWPSSRCAGRPRPIGASGWPSSTPTGRRTTRRSAPCPRPIAAISSTATGNLA